MTELTTELTALDSLMANPRNPRSHHLDTITESIDRFGIVDRPTLDERTGYIISGHGRVQALKQMRERKEPAPEGIHVTEEGIWLVPTNRGWSSRDDNEASAALIAMNRTGELGAWKEDALLELLQEISDAGETLETTFAGIGYSQVDIDNLMEELAAAASAGEEDEVVGIPAEPESAPEAGTEQPPAEPEPALADLDNAKGAGGGAKMVTIKIQDPGLIADWHDHRDLHRSDDDALRALFLGLGPVVAGTSEGVGLRIARSRIEEPDLSMLKLDDAAPTGGDAA